jgi:hypothetical protein
MMLAMAASWARRLYYIELENEEEMEKQRREKPLVIERENRPITDRHERSGAR